MVRRARSPKKIATTKVGSANYLSRTVRVIIEWVGGTLPSSASQQLPHHFDAGFFLYRQVAEGRMCIDLINNSLEPLLGLAGPAMPSVRGDLRANELRRDGAWVATEPIPSSLQASHAMRRSLELQSIANALEVMAEELLDLTPDGVARPPSFPRDCS